MQAAYPFIDEFLPAGTVANLERLGRILAGNVPGRTSSRPHRRAGGRRLPSAEDAARAAARAAAKAAARRPLGEQAPARLANRQGAWAGPHARRTTGFADPSRPRPIDGSDSSEPRVLA